MTQYLTSVDAVIGEVVDLLRLPKYTTEFTLRAKVNELVTVTATFIPESQINTEDWTPVTRTYELAMKEVIPALMAVGRVAGIIEPGFEA